MTKSNSSTMEISKAVPRAINIALNKLKNPNFPVPYMQSKPGAGKSRRMEFYCQQNNIGFLPVHLAFISLEELGGLPRFDEFELNGEKFEGTRWTVPELITKLYKLAENFKYVILFIDDYHLCGPSHQTLGYEMFTEHRLRGYALPPNCGIVLAGNDTSKAAMKTLSSGIVNRCYIMKVYTDFDIWKKDFAIPTGLFFPGVQFLSYSAHRHLFHGEEQVNEPWPSPRAWTNAFNILDMIEKSDGYITDFDAVHTISGNCGDIAASEFVGWYTLFRNVDTKQIFDHKVWSIPKELDKLFIFQSAISLEFFERVLNKKKDVYNTMAQIIVEIASQSAEMSLSCFKTIVDYSKIHKMRNVYSTLITEISRINPEVRQDISRAITSL